MLDGSGALEVAASKVAFRLRLPERIEEPIFHPMILILICLSSKVQERIRIRFHIAAANLLFIKKICLWRLLKWLVHFCR